LITFHDISWHIQEEEKLRQTQKEAEAAFQEAQHHQQQLDILRQMTETLNQSKIAAAGLTPLPEDDPANRQQLHHLAAFSRQGCENASRDSLPSKRNGFAFILLATNSFLLSAWKVFSKIKFTNQNS
jgi:hypothetical protein